MEWLLVGLGLLILMFAGDALVRGAVNLSLRMGIPALIVGLTVVGFGTSAPELLVSIKAAMEGVPGIALGNVVGSNIANVLLILGIPALIATLHTADHDTRKSFLVMIAASVLFIALAFTGTFGPLAGVVLLWALALILWDAGRDAVKHRKANAACEDEEVEGADPDMPCWKIGMFLALGLVGLPLGADLLVDNAVIIARDFGVSETVIGLTLVAIGTSLPELATTVMSTLRKQSDVALGNVIGSNYFNLCGIIGVTALVAPVPVEETFLSRDLWVMLGASLMLIPFVFLGKNITKLWGLLLLGLYVLYAVVALI
jgi:cation:H+ antiporter